MGNVMGRGFTKIPPLIKTGLKMGSCALIAYYVLKKLGVPVELRIGVRREGGRPGGVGIWSSEAKSVMKEVEIVIVD